MATLHIEHEITDLDLWRSAFDRFAELRRAAGVRGHRIAQPVDDRHWIVVDLDFDTAGEAASFLDVLRTRVWSSPDTAPALAGTPTARVLETVAVARGRASTDQGRVEERA